MARAIHEKGSRAFRTYGGFSGHLPPEALQRGKTGAGAGKIRCPVGRLSGRPAIKRNRPRQNCIPQTEQPGKHTPAGGANPYPDYVSKGPGNFTKGGRISEKRNPAAQSSQGKIGRTGERYGRKSKIPHSRTAEHYANTEGNERKMPRHLNLPKHSIILASVI